MCYNRNVSLERGLMIRRARKIDKEEIDKLYKDWNENYGHDDLTSCFFDRFDQGFYEDIVCCEEDGRIVSAAVVCDAQEYDFPDEFSNSKALLFLGTHSKFEKKGYASKLLSYILNSNLNRNGIVVDVAQTDHYDFYKRFGFFRVNTDGDDNDIIFAEPNAK